MITKEDIQNAKKLKFQSRSYLAKMDRYATRMQSYRINQAFSHIEKAENIIEKLEKEI